MGKSDESAAGGFDFKRQPDSCLGLLDYLQRALDGVWEHVHPTPEPKRIIRQNRMTLSHPTPDEIMRKQQAELERRVAYFEQFVAAFRQVSYPLRELFDGRNLTLPEVDGFEQCFIDFEVRPAADWTPRSINLDPLNSVETFFPQIAAEILKAAFDSEELPEGWSPGQATVRFNRDQADAIERYPAFPIRSAADVIQWLERWHRRCAKPPRQSPYDRLLRSHWECPEWTRLTDEDSCAPEWWDLARELRNCRRAIVTIGVTARPNWEGDPPDLVAAEDRIMALIDLLRVGKTTTLDQHEAVDRQPPQSSKRSGDNGEAPIAEFVFRPDGDGYFLNGFGEQGHVTARRAKGLHDLFRLVQSPGVPVPMLELDTMPGVKRAEGDGRSIQPVVDALGLREVAAEVKRLEADIASIDPTSPASNMERAELEKKLGELRAEATKMRGKDGKVRDLNASDLNRMKSKIWGRINTVCNQIEPRFPKLSRHFRDTTGAVDGAFYGYTPGIPDLKWDTDAKMVGLDPTK